MDRILHYYFKNQRINKNLSLVNVATVSLIDSTLVRMYEENEYDLDDAQTIRLFNSIGINYRKIFKEYTADMNEIYRILKQIYYYDNTFREKFKILENRLNLCKDAPVYNNFLVLKSMIDHKREDFETFYQPIAEKYYDYLSTELKQVYKIASGQHVEFKNQIEEALEYYFTAYRLGHSAASSTISKFISSAYQKQDKTARAHKYSLLAKQLYEKENNFCGVITTKIYDGIINFQLHNLDEALDIFQDCAKLAEEYNLQNINASSINNMIMTYMTKKEYHQMLVNSEKLVRLKYKKADIFFYKIWAYYNIHEYEAAEFVIECARKDIPDDISNMALIEMTEALMHNSDDKETKLLYALDIITKYNSRIMVYFVLDIITDYYYAQNNFEQACKYLLMKRSYQEETI